MKRLTVSLEEITIKRLEELSAYDGSSLSEVVRLAVSLYYNIRMGNKKISPEEFGRIAEMVLSRNNVLLDLGAWIAIMDELNEKAGEDFWEKVRKIGEDYGYELKELGIREPKKVLKFFEDMNWFSVKELTEDTFVLVLNSRNESKFLRNILEGVFKVLGAEVEIVEGLRKIMIRLSFPETT